MSQTASRTNFSIGALLRVFDDSASDTRAKVITIYAFLISINIGLWILTFLTFGRTHPLLLGTALLAYTFGLRHAVDADHISAIDNVTRKLMQEGKRPVATGFFFSLGHSTVVVLMSVGIAIAATAVKKSLPGLQNVGGLVGTSVSALFLYIIAFINILVLTEVFSQFQRVKNGEPYSDQSLNDFLDNRGLMGRFFKPLIKFVSKTWHMYPMGFLFGLGFDTATEVGLLGIAAIEAGKGLPIWSILLFPALFTAGMSLLDTTDGVLMLGAYGWAYVKPIRKLYYNMNVTFVSVLVALVVGTIEALSIFAGQLGMKGGVWDGIGKLSDNFGTIGVIIIGIFVVSWVGSTVLYRVKRYDDLDVAMAPEPSLRR